MKRIFILVAALGSLLINPVSFAQNPEDSFDYSVIASQKHPRLFLNDADFKAVKKTIARGDVPCVNKFHEMLMEQAEKYASQENKIVYQLDKAGRRLGDCGAMPIISSCAYAYRYTGEKKYLETAEKAMNDLCDFKDWMPSHFLGTARIALGLSIGYDWLYKKLSAETKTKVLENLRVKAFEASTQGKNGVWYNWLHNWNQVCNAGLIGAAVATYESNREISEALIKKGVTTNRKTVQAVYSPDGASPEGPGYWGYGTSRQTWLNMILDYNLGTDFGLSAVSGFDKTGEYIVYMRSNINKYFNYSDNGEKAGINPSLWYFAAKFGQTGLLYGDLGRLDAYKGNELLIIMLVCAKNIGVFEPLPPTKNYFIARGGEVPVATFRTGWEKNDIFLGVKAGTAHANHAHMDVGSFVYDAYGVRWAKDPKHSSYASLEVPLKKFNQGLFYRSQNAYRWQILQFNNRYHNTLTINDRDHIVKGVSEFTDVWTDADCMGAKQDFTSIFGGEVKKAERTCRIIGSSYLEVIDEVMARDSEPSIVRWNMTTEAVPEITPEGIVLTVKDKTVILNATGAKVEYKTWSTNPKDYSGPTRGFEPWNKAEKMVGFEFIVPAGETVKVVSTLKRK